MVGHSCVIIDDLVDTAGTLCQAAAALKDHGASRVVAYCTHPVLSGRAVENINESRLDELVVTNTIPLRPEALACGRIRQLSIGELLAETMRRVSSEESVSSLFVGRCQPFSPSLGNAPYGIWLRMPGMVLGNSPLSYPI